MVGAFGSCDRRQQISHVGKHVKEVDLLGVDELRHGDEFVVAKIFVG
jgi:hypothetical protein